MNVGSSHVYSFVLIPLAARGITSVCQLEYVLNKLGISSVALETLNTYIRMASNTRGFHTLDV